MKKQTVKLICSTVIAGLVLATSSVPLAYGHGWHGGGHGWHGGGWHGGGWRGGVYVGVGPGYYYNNGPYYGPYYGPNYHCGWVRGHWAGPNWIPSHRACWYY